MMRQRDDARGGRRPLARFMLELSSRDTQVERPVFPVDLESVALCRTNEATPRVCDAACAPIREVSAFDATRHDAQNGTIRSCDMHHAKTPVYRGATDSMVAPCVLALHREPPSRSALRSRYALRASALRVRSIRSARFVFLFQSFTVHPSIVARMPEGIPADPLLRRLKKRERFRFVRHRIDLDRRNIRKVRDDSPTLCDAPHCLNLRHLRRIVRFRHRHAAVIRDDLRDLKQHLFRFRPPTRDTRRSVPDSVTCQP